MPSHAGFWTLGSRGRGLGAQHPMPTVDPEPGRCSVGLFLNERGSLPAPGGTHPEPSLSICSLGSPLHLLMVSQLGISLLLTMPETEMAQYKGNMRTEF